MNKHIGEREWLGTIRKYWELEDFSNSTKNHLLGELDAKGYKVKRSSQKPELIFHRERLERGLLCYSNCSKEELLDFADVRGLDEGHILTKYSRKSVQQRLEQVDREPKFTRFLDLPTELRLTVMKYYVDSFHKHPDTLRPPPLGLTSRQMMSEVRPVYYDRCTFQLDFEESIPHPDKKTSRVLSALQKNDTFSIRNVRIRRTLINTTVDVLVVHRDISIELGCSGVAKPGGYEVIDHLLYTKLNNKKRLREVADLGTFLTGLTSEQKRKGFGFHEVSSLVEIIDARSL